MVQGAGEEGEDAWLHQQDGEALLVLWLHSAKQKKVKPAKELTPGLPARLPDSVSNWGYADPSLPLVVDIGCGFGTTLLGMARHGEGLPTLHEEPNLDGLELEGCNFVGVDLFLHSVGYANGLAMRWGLGARCRFFVASGESLLQRITAEYPGPVVLMMVQYPTPYKLGSHPIREGKPLPAASAVGGKRKAAASLDPRVAKRIKPSADHVPPPTGDKNSQLPTIDEGFMMSSELAGLLYRAAATSSSYIYIQSNVEDVAVTMSERIEQAAQGALQPYVGDEIPAAGKADVTDLETGLRQERWRELGGASANGKGWLASAAFPFARTETEASYERMKKGQYRKLWMHK